MNIKKTPKYWLSMNPISFASSTLTGLNGHLFSSISPSLQHSVPSKPCNSSLKSSIFFPPPSSIFYHNQVKIQNYRSNRIQSCPTKRVNADECCHFPPLDGFNKPGSVCSFLLCNSSKLHNLQLVLQVHGHMIVFGVELCEFVGSQLLEFYS